MSLKTYPAYKVTNSPLLGVIPSNWKAARLGTALNIKKDIVGDAWSRHLLLSLTLKGVIPRDMENRVGKLPADFTTYQRVVQGDLIFCLFDVEETPRTVGWVPEPGMITGAYTAAYVNPSFDARYIAYHYLSYDQRKSLRGYYAGLRNTIRSTDFSNIPIAYPPIDEQQTIASYLDRETAEIDAFIADQEELITLLAERRTATITQAVTKGLDPDTPLKDSGVEWFGDIPQDWGMTRIKHVGTTHIGLTYSPEDIVEGSDQGTLVLRSGNIQNGNIDLADRVYVNKTVPASIVTQRGDILICARNGSRALIGKNALIDGENADQTFGAFMTVLRSKDSEYLYWLLNSSLFKAQMGLFVTATINQLTNATLNNFIVPMPPASDRSAITAYLQSETKKIDSAIADAREAIALSQERRAAVISAAVTGKIDVRGLVGPEANDVEGVSVGIA